MEARLESGSVYRCPSVGEMDIIRRKQTTAAQ